MNEEEKKSKSPKVAAILLICMIIALIIIIGCALYGYSLKKSGGTENLAKTENVSTAQNVTKTEQSKTETVSIKTNQTKVTNDGVKYDLKNNILSNFDIAFLKLENNKENKIYSPLSIKYTLKMLEEGANGEAKKQISDVLNDYNVTKYISNKNMSLANSLFVRDSFQNSVLQSYINNIKGKYNAEVVFDSFETANNVNNWIKEKTLNLIPKMLNDSDLDEEDFVLINALGIDMEWENKFLISIENYEKGFVSSVLYNHEDYYAGCNTMDVVSKKFDNNKQNISSMEVFASIDNYDIVKILGEENIRKTVGEKYREWINQNGTNSWGEEISGDDEIEKEISNFLDKYITELKNNYIEYGEKSSTDFSIYTDNDIKVFAKDLKEYNGTTLQYIGIMPTKQNLDEYVKNVDNIALNKIISNLKDLKKENFKDGVITKITGFIPKFNFDYTLNLKEDLAKLGITDVFDSEKADISNLCSTEGEYINDAQHKANIEFTQDGIKAAAATVVGGAGAGGPEFDYIYDVPVEEIDLTFDKPYMFIIRDLNTGDVWFAGTVYEPLAWENDTTRTGM